MQQAVFRLPPFCLPRGLRLIVALGLGLSAMAGLLPRAASGLPPDGSPDAEECTIAVMSGRATPDGRPVLWKNRDAAYLNNEVSYFTDGAYRYVALINAGDPGNAWIGVNERGFAILNALSYNLPDNFQGGITNGMLMKRALQTCASVGDFKKLMIQTNTTGRENPANLAVIDAVGGAEIYEAGNLSFTRFDVTNPQVAPMGFLVRTNFSLSVDTTTSDTWRYNRCRRLIKDAVADSNAGVAFLLQKVARDLRAVDLDPYPLPFEGAPPGWPSAFGYVNTSNTINRRTTVAGGAIHGVAPGEDPLLSTFWAVLGQPVFSIPVPVWVAAGTTPAELDGPYTAPFCDASIERYQAAYDYMYSSSLLNTRDVVNETRLGFLTQCERIERWLLPEVRRNVETWRVNGVDPTAVAAFEHAIATDAYGRYTNPDWRIPVIYGGGGTRWRATPNPMRADVEIHYELPDVPPSVWTVDLFDATGRRIRRLTSCDASRTGTLDWDGCDGEGSRVAPGVYFLKPTWPAGAEGTSLVVAR
jgi:hypothetical protein